MGKSNLQTHKTLLSVHIRNIRKKRSSITKKLGVKRVVWEGPNVMENTASVIEIKDQFGEMLPDWNDGPLSRHDASTTYTSVYKKGVRSDQATICRTRLSTQK